jgi:hypothetical protein
MHKITVATDPSLQQAGGNEVAARFVIELENRQRIEELATLETGAAQPWITEEELAEKFQSCAARALPPERIDPVFELLRGIEQCDNLDPLMRRLRNQ